MADISRTAGDRQLRREWLRHYLAVLDEKRREIDLLNAEIAAVYREAAAAGVPRPVLKRAVEIHRTSPSDLDAFLEFAVRELVVQPNPAKRRELREGECSVVYFLEAPGAGLIKIGVSIHAHRRIASLQTGSPVALRLLTTIPGDTATEAALHRRFSHLRERGEWFRAGVDLREFIASIGAAHRGVA